MLADNRLDRKKTKFKDAQRHYRDHRRVVDGSASKKTLVKAFEQWSKKKGEELLET